jgi:hypothetical protein
MEKRSINKRGTRNRSREEKRRNTSTTSESKKENQEISAGGTRQY